MRAVEVVFHHEGDLWWAEATVDGEFYGASCSDLEQLRGIVAEGLEFMLDEPVEVDERRDTKVTLHSNFDLLTAAVSNSLAAAPLWRHTAHHAMPRRSTITTLATAGSGSTRTLAGSGA